MSDSLHAETITLLEDESTDKLEALQMKVAQTLRTINHELIKRHAQSSDFFQQSPFIQASYYFNLVLKDENAGPGELGSIRSYFDFFIDKEIHRRAVLSSETELLILTRKQMEQLRDGAVSQ